MTSIRITHRPRSEWAATPLVLLATLLATRGALLGPALLGPAQFGAWGGVASGQEPSEFERAAVESGRRALEQSSVPWYDAEQEGIRRIDVQPPADLKNRQSDWERRDQRNNQNNSSGSVFGRFAQTVGWIAIVVAFVALAGFLYWAYVRRESGESLEPSEPHASDEELSSRVEKLPVDFPVSGEVSMLEQADAFERRGDWKLATICLYAHALVEMDRHHVLRLEKGRTNRQYEAELRGRPDLQRSFRHLVVAFEDAYFGDYAVDETRYQATRSWLRECEARWSQPLAEEVVA